MHITRHRDRRRYRAGSGGYEQGFRAETEGSEAAAAEAVADAAEAEVAAKHLRQGAVEAD